MSRLSPTMDAVPQKGEESKEVNVGKIHESGLSALPEGESQALSQRGEMLYGEVRLRPEELSSWTARPGPEKILGLRRPASRKAESQTALRYSGKPISQHLQRGGPTKRDYRRTHR